MSEKLKGLLQNKNNLIVLVLIGVLLMVVTLPVNGEDDVKKETDVLFERNNDSYLIESKEMTADTQEYAAEMERKLAQVLQTMEGAGKVQVFITLASSEERIIEKDMPVNRSNTVENDAQGGSRTVSNVDAGENTVYTTEGNTTTPYVVKTVTPKVEGVLVLAQGAGNGAVSKNIADAVQVLFGIEAHQVKVIKMETSNR